MHDSPPNLSDYRNGLFQCDRRKALHQPGYLFRDRYKIVKALAAGGFGVTYLVQDGAIPGNPLCVVKQLCPKVSNQMALERARRRFRKEAKVLSKVGSHSQIPRLLDYFTIKEEFYLVQEYIHGEVLTKEVRRLGRQSEAQVKQFLLDILPVVKFIHRCRIIHRDIKPPNIIRCADDKRLVLIDFGAVRECLGELSDGSYQVPLTQFVGTPGFAPPEQQALRPTYASDIYALGMTCLYLLTGRTPIEFDSDPSTGNVLWQHLVNVSDHFAGVIRKMLRADYTERYQSADEVIRALTLEPYLDNLSTGLSYQPRPTAAIAVQEDNLVPMDGYLSPVQRQAVSIRRWKSRQNNPKNTPPARTGFSMSTGTSYKH